MPNQNPNQNPNLSLPKTISIVKLGSLDITDVVSLYLWKEARFQLTETSDKTQTFPVTLYTDSKTTCLGLLNDEVYNGSKDLLTRSGSSLVENTALEKLAFNERKKIISDALSDDEILDIEKITKTLSDQYGKAEEVKKIQAQQARYIDTLKKMGITIVDMADKENNPARRIGGDKGGKLYSMVAYYLGSTELAERAIRSYLVLNPAGINVQLGTYPLLSASKLVRSVLSLPRRQNTYLNKAAGVSLLADIAGILSANNVIPPLDRDEREKLESLKAPYKNAVPDHPAYFSRLDLNTRIADKDLEVIGELFKPMSITRLEDALKYSNIHAPIAPITNEIDLHADYILRTAGIVASLPKSEKPICLISHQLSDLETVFESGDGRAQLNTISDENFTKTSKTTLKELFDLGPYGAPINEMDPYGELLGRDAFKGDSSKKKIVDYLNRHNLLYYETDNSHSEASGSGHYTGSDKKIILLMSKKPETLIQARQEYLKNPGKTVVYMRWDLTKKQKGVNRAEILHPNTIIHGTPFQPTKDTTLSIRIEYSTDSIETQHNYQYIIKFVKSIFGDSIAASRNNQGDVIINDLDVQALHYERPKQGESYRHYNDLYKKLTYTQNSGVHFSSIHKNIYTLNNEYPDYAITPLRQHDDREVIQNSSTLIEKPLLLLPGQDNQNQHRDTLKQTSDADGSLNIELIADAFGLKELIKFQLTGKKINNIIIKAYSPALLKGFKAAFRVALSKKTYQKLIDGLEGFFEERELQPLKALRSSHNYINLSSSFHEFFASDQGKVIEKNILETQLVYQIPEPLPSDKRPILLLPDQDNLTSDRENLQYIVNNDGSFTVSVYGDAFGLRELIGIKGLKGKVIQSIDVCTDNPGLRKGFNIAFESALTHKKYISFINDLKKVFDDRELVPLEVLNGKYSEYKKKSAPFHTLFSSETGKELAKKILGLQAGDQIPPYLLPDSLLRPFLPGTKSLSCTINNDRSLNIRVTATPDGLYNLISFKLFNYQISRIDIDSESPERREEFKIAFKSVQAFDKFAQLKERLRPLTDIWLESLKKLYRKYTQDTDKFKTFFDSERGKALIDNMFTPPADHPPLLPPRPGTEPRLLLPGQLSQIDNFTYTKEDEGLHIKVRANVYGLKELISFKKYNLGVHRLTVLSDNPQLRKGFKNAFVIAIKARKVTELVAPLEYVFDDKELAPLRVLGRAHYKRTSDQFRTFFESPEGKEIYNSVLASLPSDAAPPEFPQLPEPPGPLEPQSPQAGPSGEFLPDNQRLWFSLTQEDLASVNSDDLDTSILMPSDTEGDGDSDIPVKQSKPKKGGVTSESGAISGKEPPRKRIRLSPPLSLRGMIQPEDNTQASTSASVSSHSGDPYSLPASSPQQEVSQDFSNPIPIMVRPGTLSESSPQHGTGNDGVEVGRADTSDGNILSETLTAVQNLTQEIHSLGQNIEPFLDRSITAINDSQLQHVNRIIIRLREQLHQNGESTWLMIDNRSYLNDIIELLKLDVAEMSQEAARRPAVMTLRENVQALNLQVTKFLSMESEFNDQERKAVEKLFGDIDAGCSSSGRQKRDTSCSRPDPDSFGKKADRFVQRLFRRSKSPRSIFTLPGTRYSRVDIGALSARPGSLMARIQAKLKWQRSFRADAALKRKPVRGFHTIVALDVDSWLSAQQQGKNNPNTEALLYRPEQGILLSPYGESVTRIPGGAYNSLSLVGKLGSIDPGATPKAEMLRGFIREFCHQESIGSVLMQNTDGDNDAFKGFIKDFTRLPKTVFNNIGSFHFKSAHEKNAPEFLLRAHESSVIRLSSPKNHNSLHPRLDPVAYRRFSQAMALNGLPNKVKPLSALINPQSDQPLTASLMSKHQKAEALALAFTNTMSSIYESNRISDDYIPLLDTLRKMDQGWQMEFIHPVTKDRKATSFTSDVVHDVKVSLGSKKLNRAFKSFSRRLKKLTTSNANTRKGLFLLSMHDGAQMVMGWMKSGFLMDSVEKTPGMSDSLYKSLQAQSFVNFGLGVIEAIEMVEDLSKINKLFNPSKTTNAIRPFQPGKAIGGSKVTLTPPKGLKLSGKSLKLAGRSLGPLLSVTSAGLSTHIWKETKDPEMKSLQEKRMIMEWVGVAVSFVAFAGHIGLAIAAAFAIISFLIISLINGDIQAKILKKMDRQIIDALNQGDKFFNTLYQQMDTSHLFDMIPEEIINLVRHSAKSEGTGMYIGVRELDLIKKTLKLARIMINTYDYEVEETAGEGEGYKYEGTFSSRGREDLVANYLSTDCKSGKRLDKYQCEDGTFHLGSLMPQGNSTLVMPMVPDWNFNPFFVKYDKKRIKVAHTTTKDLFDAASESNPKIKQVYKDTVWVRATSRSIGKNKEFAHITAGIKHIEYLASNTTTHLDDKNHQIVFPYSRDHEGLITYRFTIPQGSETINYLHLMVPTEKELADFAAKDKAEAETKAKLKAHLTKHFQSQRRPVHPEQAEMVADERVESIRPMITREEGLPYRNIVIDMPRDTPVQWLLPHKKDQTLECTKESTDESNNCKITFDPDKKTLTLQLRRSRLTFNGYWPDAEADKQYRIVIKEKNGVISVSPHYEAPHIKMQLLKSSHHLTDIEARRRWLRQLVQTYPPAQRFLPVSLLNCPANQKLPFALYRQNIDLSESQYNCFMPLTRTGSPIKKEMLERTSLWFDTKHNVEVLLVLPKSAVGKQVVPVGGDPKHNYFFYAPKTEMMYSGETLNAGFKKVYDQDYAYIYKEAPGFAHPVSSFAPIEKPIDHSPDEAPHSFVVTTKKGVGYTLSANPPGKVLSLPVFINTESGALDEAFSQVAEFKNILPLYINKTRNINDVTQSGFYDPANNIALTYISSRFDFYSRQHFLDACSPWSGALDLVFKPETQKLSLLELSTGGRRRQNPTYHCFQRNSTGTHLVLTTDTRQALRRDHIPVHRFRRGADVYYVMLSRLSGDLYYIKINQPEDSTRQIMPDSDFDFTVIALDNSYKDHLKNSRNGSSADRQAWQDARFTEVLSQDNGLIAYTRGGYILYISNDNMEASTLLKRFASSESYEFDKWFTADSRTVPADPVRALNFNKLPSRSGASLVGLDLGLIANRVFDQSFGGGSAPETTWNQTTAERFITALKRELKRLSTQFEKKWGFAGPDLIRLSATNTLRDIAPLAFLKQADFWFAPDDNALLALPGGKKMRFVGENDEGVLALESEPLSLPYLFRYQPTQVSPTPSTSTSTSTSTSASTSASTSTSTSASASASTPTSTSTSASTPTPTSTPTPASTQADHPYCQGNTYLDAALPRPFHGLISVACKDISDASPADYQLNLFNDLWQGRYEGFQFEVSKKHKLLTGFDLTKSPSGNTKEIWYSYPGLPSGASLSRKRLHLKTVLDQALKRLPDTPLADYPKQSLLSLDLGDNVRGLYTHKGWYDWQQKRLFISPPSYERDILHLIGSRNSDTSSDRPVTGYCYNRSSGKLYRIGHSAPLVLPGEYDDLSIVDQDNSDQANGGQAKILQIVGTDKDDLFIPSSLYMDRIYPEGATNAMTLRTDFKKPNELILLMVGKKGTDRFTIMPDDLRYFKQVVIELNLATPQTPETPNVIHIHEPSHLYAALQRGSDLVLKNRYEPEAGEIVIKGVWPGLDGYPLAPTQIKFSDLRFFLGVRSIGLDELSDTLVKHRKGIFFALVVNDDMPEITSYRVSPTPEAPLFIDLLPGFKVVPEKTSDGIVINFTGPGSDSDSVENRVSRKITLPGDTVMNSSVFIRQPKARSVHNRVYRPFSFDDHSGLRHGTADVRLRDHVVLRHDRWLRCDKPHPLPKGSKYVKCVAIEANAIGHQLVSRVQLDDPDFIPGAEQRPTHVCLDKPDKAGVYPVYYVFYGINDPGQLQFSFGRTEGAYRWRAWQGAVPAGEGVVANHQPGLNIKLVNDRNESSIYRVILGGSIELHELEGEPPQWQASLTDDHYTLGPIDTRKAAFNNLQPLLFLALREQQPRLDGVILTGGNTNQVVSLSHLASMLSNAAPLLFTKASESDSALMEGNSLNNILYCGKDCSVKTIRGRRGDDLLILGGQSPKPGRQPTAQPGNRNHCNSSTYNSHDRVTLKGGMGNDLYFIEASARPSKIHDPHGQHTVFLEAGADVDLRSLGSQSLTLYLGMTSDQVLPVLCDKRTGASRSLRQSDVSEVKSGSQGESHWDNHFLKLTSSTTGETIALLNINTLRKLNFHDRIISNPKEWVTGTSQPRSDKQDHDELSLISKLVEGAKDLVRLLLPGSQKVIADTCLANNNALYTPPAAEHFSNAEVNRSVLKLVHFMSNFEPEEAQGILPTSSTSTAFAATRGITTPPVNSTSTGYTPTTFG
ncbi:hypothetical protein [Endozoicomonas euniceicola]|uniref:Uncharacterized protein n=1 Tax=Endozoicomonas euniceicola TaxID=1234143 RepID=A0ABY6GY43_9GAMM|nr:hypothetical protein [Endozoicomonas euniceicola]UYM17710.1 hypothetical protein NX720_07325 [Endozoicomonas euniceicola]